MVIGSGVYCRIIADSADQLGEEDSYSVEMEESAYSIPCLISPAKNREKKKKKDFSNDRLTPAAHYTEVVHPMDPVPTNTET